MVNLKNLVIAGLFAVSLQGCFAVVAGAAVGAATTVAVYDSRSAQERLSDLEINKNIINTLNAHPEISNNCHIVVSTFHGTVLLTGQAPAHEFRNTAISISKSVQNVKKIYNEIEIAQPISGIIKTDDSILTARIKSMFLVEKGLKSGEIKITTENSTVFLMGYVTRNQADIAVDIAKNVSGVQKVVKIFEYE